MQGPCANRLRCLCGLSVLLLAPKLSFARDSAVVKQADAPAALERTTDGTGPYAARPSAGALLEKTSRGEIDWTDGYVVAYGRARLIKGPDPGI
ncbi:MAG: hypothetical protein M1491_02840, partial [Deltaproteobacteria bacterium]|nr:hypothetical protein [Deltaproteobacteria bacterium]